MELGTKLELGRLGWSRAARLLGCVGGIRRSQGFFPQQQAVGGGKALWALGLVWCAGSTICTSKLVVIFGFFDVSRFRGRAHGM